MTAENITSLSPGLLDRPAFFAPVPTFNVSAEGAITDANIAARILFRTDPQQALDPGLQIVLAREGEQACMSGGQHQADAEVPEGPSIRHQTPDFGWAALRRTFVQHLNAGTGTDQGTTFYLEPTSLERESEYLEAFAWETRRQSIWESYAKSYDRVLPNFSFYTEVVARHVDYLHEQAPTDILDLGAGTGNVCLRIRTNHRTVALDASRAMLNKLRGKLDGESDHGELLIIERSAEDLACWKEPTFGAVSILLALYDMARPAQALAEAIRVLRPGGVMVMTEPRRTFNLQFMLEKSKELLVAAHRYYELEQDWQRVTLANLELDPTQREDRLFIEDVIERVEDDGLQVRAVKDSHYGNCATIFVEKPRRS